MRPPESPSSSAITTIAKSTPGPTKFASPNRNAVVRWNGLSQRKRQPSASRRRTGARSVSRSSSNGVRIVSSATAETAYDSACTTNGSPRATANSAPPSGGAASITTASRPVMVEIAAGSCRRGTTARSAPVCAAPKYAAPAPSTNATARIIQSSTRSRKTTAPRLPTATARTACAPIITRRRFQRSAASPAGSANSAIGSSRANPTSPACAAEPVSASTSSGYAIPVIDDPPLESSCAAWSRRKSRLRWSGVAVTSRR